VRCPTCKQAFPDESREFRPFCSRRCKLIDLGNWLSGSYAVPGEAADEDDLAEAGELEEEFRPPRAPRRH
jgi:hypothetical protein